MIMPIRGLASIWVVAAVAPLGACAMSAAGIAREDVDMVIESDKDSRSFATCVAETMRWGPEMRSEGDHYWVMRMSSYNTPTIRWDFWPREGGGSRAEMRSTIPIMGGDERVRACA